MNNINYEILEESFDNRGFTDSENLEWVTKEINHVVDTLGGNKKSDLENAIINLVVNIKEF